MNVGFEIILQWLQSMKRKTCKLSINKLCCCKVCDDYYCVHEAINLTRSTVEIKVIRDCDSFTSPFSVTGPENSPQM